MNDKVKKLIGNKNNLLILVLLGVLMLVIALPVKENTGNAGDTGNKGKTGSGTSGTVQNKADAGNGAAGASQAAYAGSDTESYAAWMEEKLEEALSQMAGAGKVKVVISMKSSEEKVVEKDQPVTRSNTSETDSGGGTRNINNLETGESTVYSSEGTDSEPYVVKVIQPEVEGVIVLAEGAGTGNVSKNISEAIQVLFGIDAHKIKVVKMKTQ